MPMASLASATALAMGSAGSRESSSLMRATFCAIERRRPGAPGGNGAVAAAAVAAAADGGAEEDDAEEEGAEEEGAEEDGAGAYGACAVDAAATRPWP